MVARLMIDVMMAAPLIYGGSAADLENSAFDQDVADVNNNMEEYGGESDKKLSQRVLKVKLECDELIGVKLIALESTTNLAVD